MEVKIKLEDLPQEAQDRIRQINEHIDYRVRQLCEELGYGAVAQSAMKLEKEWRERLARGDVP